MLKTKEAVIIKKMIDQLKNDISRKELSKLNLYYNRHVEPVIKSSNFENLMETLDNYVILSHNSEKADWVYSTLTTELNRIAKEGKGTIKYKLNFEEYSYLVKWLKEQVR